MRAGAEIWGSEQSSIKAPLGGGTEKEASSLLPRPRPKAPHRTESLHACCPRQGPRRQALSPHSSAGDCFCVSLCLPWPGLEVRAVPPGGA